MLAQLFEQLFQSIDSTLITNIFHLGCYIRIFISVVV